MLLKQRRRECRERINLLTVDTDQQYLPARLRLQSQASAETYKQLSQSGFAGVSIDEVPRL